MFTYYKNPLLIHQGHMQWLFDHQGTRYLVQNENNKNFENMLL